jgi:hypothetical protein
MYPTGFPKRWSFPRRRILRDLLLPGLLLFAASGCQDEPSPVAPDSPALFSAAGAEGDLITSDPMVFAEALQRIGNESEILIVLKDESVPRVASDFLLDLPLSADLVIGLPETAATAPRRRTPGFARAGARAHSEVLRTLTASGIEPYRHAPWAEVIAVRLPDEKLVPVLTSLLQHPNVDYIEANQKRPVLLDGGPLGSNPYDTKHTFHKVLEAWDYTRGGGAIVGVLDSGFAYDRNTGQWHEDGQLLTTTKGIQKNGFVDDYDAINNCDVTGGQPYGDCVPWDDHGHGTPMAGLVGENDNNLGYVGIMPEGLTISMKIAQNCSITGGCGSISSTFHIEDDDFYWGVKWASYNDVQVLSMSFSANHGWNSSVYNALYDAYHSYDILLLSSTGNPGDEGYEYPQKWSFVMGVGGLNSDGSNYGLDAYQEVSALAGGVTTLADCPSIHEFCSPGTYGVVGGTSSSTAITAGIAGLVRTYNSTLTAPQVRERLRATADPNQHYKVIAVAAVLNDRYTTVDISGPSYIDVQDTYTWEAMPVDGDGSYSYQWYVYWYNTGSWQTLGTSKTQSLAIMQEDGDFDMRVDVVSGDENASDTQFVYNAIGCSGVEIC